MDICFPWKNLLNAHVLKKQSWITHDILNLKSLLFELIELKNKFPNNNELQLKIDELTTYYNKLIKRERTSFYSNMIIESRTTLKTMWHIVNIEKGKSNCSKTDYTEIINKAEGHKSRNKQEIVNLMNRQFVSAAEQCGAPKANIEEVALFLEEAYTQSDRSVRLQKFTTDEIYKIIMYKIANKPTKDIYDISVTILRLIACSLAEPLSVLFNRCLKNGVYPKVLKEVRVCPLYKGKGKKEDFNSYRPISIIPAIAKIFENGLTTRLLKFLTSTEALSDRQYAYREGRSTTMLAREVVTRILQAREHRREVAVLFCDLSKAFDVADHKILAHKLSHYGIVGPNLNLVIDFMSDRSQYVFGDHGKLRSDGMSTEIGVPQGSSLSNLAFSVLLNDLPKATTEGEIYMYADDVAAIVTANNLEELEIKLNTVASELLLWFKINGLKLNLSKTQFMTFNLSGHKRRQLVVQIEGKPVEQVQTAPFLGFYVDRVLTWESHIDQLCLKLGQACFALSRVASTLPLDAVRSCYFASVHSLLQYGTEFWGRASESERAFRMQKRAVRVMARIAYDESARPYFSRLGILTLPCILIYQVALYTRENIESFTKLGQHKYNTRNANKLASIPRTLTKTAKTLRVMGPDVYNRIPESIIDTSSIYTFKKKLKSWLIQQAFYSYTEFMNLINVSCT